MSFDYEKLMDDAIAWGRQAPKWVPKCWYLLQRVRGGLKWVLTFKLSGARAALEPVYAFGSASRDLIPEKIKSLFVQLSPEMQDFILNTVFGEVYGERFAYVEKWVEDCDDDVTLVASLGSGRGSPELVGLHRRQKAGRPMPKLLLVDASKKALEQARKYARVLGIAPDLVKTEVCQIDEDYRVPSDVGKVIVGSWGLAGNYFPDDTLLLFMASLVTQPNVAMFSTDFAGSALCDSLHNAIGWPVALTAEDDRDFAKVKPRDPDDIMRIMRCCMPAGRCSYQIKSFAREQAHILEASMAVSHKE